MLGHNSSPVDTVKSGVVLSWSVEPNWHGHRHLVNAVCESLWRASGQELALDPAFDRLLCLIGKPRRVEGWFDSEGSSPAGPQEARCSCYLHVPGRGSLDDLPAIRQDSGG